MVREMKVLPYNKNWAEDYEQIKKKLLHVFSDLAVDIQHFGSTSIEGMSAKPIIDVMVIVEDIQKVDELNSKMIKAGYKPRGENGVPERRYFQLFHEDGVNHTQHIHVYEKNNPAVTDLLMFRDYLEIDKCAFEQYQQIKAIASEMYKYSPIEYTEAKTDCVNEILNKARDYYKTK